MNDAVEILVIFISVTLGIFLFLAIIVAVKIIQILNHLKTISEKAEQIADSAESIGEFFKHGAQSMSIVKLLHNVHETVFKKSKGGKNKKWQRSHTIPVN